MYSRNRHQAIEETGSERPSLVEFFALNTQRFALSNAIVLRSGNLNPWIMVASEPEETHDAPVTVQREIIIRGCECQGVQIFLL